jgi:hypothetical protein
MEIKKRTNEEWLKLYKEQRESGKTVRTWCAENNINANTLSDRISRLRKAGMIEGVPGGKRLKKTNASSTASWIEIMPNKSPKNTFKEISVEIGKFKIKLMPDFCEKTFLCACKLLVSLC